MVESIELVITSLKVVAQSISASNIVLFIPPEYSKLSDKCLIQVDSSFPISEFNNINSVSRYFDEQHISNNKIIYSSQKNPVVELPSKTPNCAIYRISINRLIRESSNLSEALLLDRGSKSHVDKDQQFIWLAVNYGDKKIASKTAIIECSSTHIGLSIYAAELITALVLQLDLARHSSADSNSFDSVMSNSELTAKLETLIGSKKKFLLLLINPDDFKAINKQYGRAVGDRVLISIGDELRKLLGPLAIVARYSAAHFASILIDEQLSQKTISELQKELCEIRYSEKSVKLHFRIGVFVYNNQGEQTSSAASLLLKAEEALAVTRLDDQESTCVWSERLAEQLNLENHYFRGVFRSSENRNYRNMRLLWNFSTQLASENDLNDQLEHFVNNLIEHFDLAFSSVYLLEQAADFVNNELLFDFKTGKDSYEKGSYEKGSYEKGSYGKGSYGNDSKGSKECVFLLKYQEELIAKCRDSLTRQIDERKSVEKGEGVLTRCFAFPIVFEKRFFGCLYLQTESAEFFIDDGDLILIESLLVQVASLIERVRLSKALEYHQQQHKLQLEHEVKTLRSALDYSSLVYCSKEMEQLLNKAQKVAGTDAPVLVFGETGTGKELIAQTIHALSPRCNKPFVVIDCSALPDGLIESELFGHERGAFTSAGIAKKGRVVDADGGTLVLDEVGELPLPVQSKLLRFVQEKQFTAVGSSRAQNVDVRIIAVTNRNLQHEVSVGQFREDLYFRLKVVEIEPPPLRRRKKDIPFLINHFLSKYSIQYGQPPKKLTTELKKLASDYLWPGNVRELKNSVLRAAILAEKDEISAADLIPQLAQHNSHISPNRLNESQSSLDEKVFGVESKSESLSSRSGDFSFEYITEALRKQLSQQVLDAIDARPIILVPFANWLEDDLIMIAFDIVDCISKQASKLLNIPDTTFRRKLKKARGLSANNLAPRTDDWQQVRELLIKLVELAFKTDLAPIRVVNEILFDAVMTNIPENVAVASQLLAISEPTFRKRRTDHSN